MVAVKVLLSVLMLALAALAIPNTLAGSPVQCSLGPTTPGGDTDCRAQVEDCEAHTHIYDQEDALNVYEASCYDCGVRIGGGPFVQCDLIALAGSPAPLAAAAAAPDPVKTHCWSAEDGSGCSTTVLGTCTYHSGTMGGSPLASASCWTSTTGWCDVTAAPVQTPPVWCDGPRASSAAALPVTCSLGPTTPGGDTDCRATYGQCYVHTHIYDTEDALNQYEADCSGCGIHYGAGPLLTTGCYIGPPPFELDGAALAAPGLPCYTGIAGSWCTVGHADCKATAGYQTGSASYEYATVHCGPDLWAPCTVAYADTRGNVGSCLVATASASVTDPADVCVSGFAQTWCDVSAGPCDVRVTPWTAWGDHYVVSDCRIGGGAGATCHTEVHTQDPRNPEHWCAF